MDFLFTERHLTLIRDHTGLTPFLTEFNRADGRLWCGEHIWAYSLVEAEEVANGIGVRVVGKLICDVSCSGDELRQIQSSLSNSRMPH